MKRMFRYSGCVRAYPAFVVLAGMLFIQACALPPSKEMPIVQKDPFRDVPRLYRLKARQNERENNLPMAVLCWRIVDSFRPGDTEAAKEIGRLRSLSQTEAQKHYLLALKYSEDKRTDAVQNELLKALFYSPDNRQTRAFLEKSFSQPDFIPYRVKNSDNDASIARNVYHDAEKGFLVAYFSDSSDPDSLTPGELLHLPIIEPAPVVKKPQSVTSVQKAQDLFKAKKYQEAISLAENIVAYGPSTTARDIINASYYALGLQEFRAGHFSEAMKFFTMVNRDYEQTGDYIRRIRNQLHVMADYHYKKGVHYFVDEKLEKAIAEWKTTLRLNPEHGKARADLEKARTMLKNLNEIK
jgi:tetratricopeptide (TPR) repeat protein